MPIGLREHVDQDNEGPHVRARPPGQRGQVRLCEGRDRRVRVLPNALVAIDDLDARLVFSRPHVGAGIGVVVPPWQSLRERPPEHLAEIPGLGDRQVFDQAEEIGPR